MPEARGSLSAWIHPGALREALPTPSFSASLPSILSPTPCLWQRQDPARGSSWTLQQLGMMILELFLTASLLHAGKSSPEQSTAKRNLFRASSFAPETKSPLADSAAQSLLLHSRPVRMMVSVLSRTWSLARTEGTEPFLLLLLLSGGRAWLVRPQGRESLPFPSWEQETRGVWSRNPVGREKEGGARRVLAPGKAPDVARAEQGCQWGTAGLQPGLGLPRSRALSLPVLHGPRPGKLHH